MNDRYADFDRRRAELMAGGGPERTRKQHSMGKWTARERIEALVDPASFVEFGLYARTNNPDLADKSLPADGVVTGKAEIDGRPVFLYVQDFTVGGGAVGLRHAQKIVGCLQYALKCGVPVVGINDSGGARIQEGVESLSGYGQIFYHNTLLSGVVPRSRCSPVPRPAGRPTPPP
jgi:acetyl-CoA carboxylase carboxyltransferase component